MVCCNEDGVVCKLVAKQMPSNEQQNGCLISENTLLVGYFVDILVSKNYLYDKNLLESCSKVKCMQLRLLSELCHSHVLFNCIKTVG